MAIRSTVEVDVNDESMRKFLATFDKYQDALKEQPKHWADVNKSIESSVDETIKLTDQTVKYHDTMNRTALTFRRLSLESSSISRSWSEASKAAKTLGDTITPFAQLPGLGFLRLIGGGLAGTMGVAGIMAAIIKGGIDIAEHASGEQFRTGGMRTNVGKARAFGVELGRYTDESMLERITGGMRSPLTAGVLQAVTGMGQRSDPADVAVRLMEVVSRQTRGMTPIQKQMFIEGRGLGRMIDVDTLNRVESDPDFAKKLADFRKHAGTDLSNTDAEMRRARDINTRVQREKMGWYASGITGVDKVAQGAETARGIVDNVHDVIRDTIGPFGMAIARVTPGLNAFIGALEAAKLTLDYLGGGKGAAPPAGLPDQPAHTLPAKPDKRSSLGRGTNTAGLRTYLGPLGTATAAGTGGRVDAAFGALDEIGLKDSAVNKLANALRTRAQSEITVRNQTGGDITAVAASVAAGR